MSLQADTFISRNFELNTANFVWVIPVQKYAAVTVHAEPVGTWATAIITIRRSNDGVNGYALESATTLGPGAAMSPAIDTGAFNYLLCVLTTKENSSQFANLTAVCKYDKGGA